MQVGRFTYGTENISVSQWGEGSELKIGSFCSIASNINVFLGGNHKSNWISTYPFGVLHRDQLGCTEQKARSYSNGDVVIGNDVWIAAGVSIMSGITIGDGAVVAAFSHVVKDVEPYSLVGGNPARHIKYRFSSDIIQRLMQLRWWELPVEAIKNISEDLTSEPTVELLDSLLAQHRA